MDGTHSRWGLASVILATACWSLSGFFITHVVRESGLSTWALAFWRELFTTIILYSGIRIFQPQLLGVKRRDLIWLAAMGALGMGLLHVSWNTSVVTNGMAIATVFQYNAPFFVAIAARLLWQELLSWRKVLAIVFAFVGTGLVTQFDWQAGAQISINGLVAGLGTAVAFTNFSLFGKKLSGDYSSWTILFYTFGFGTLALLPFQFRVGWPPIQTMTMTGVAAFIGLVIVSTIIGYVLYVFGLSRLQSSVAVIAATMEVPFATAVSFFLFRQLLSGRQLLGAFLVVGGVIVLSWPIRGEQHV